MPTTSIQLKGTRRALAAVMAGALLVVGLFVAAPVQAQTLADHAHSLEAIPGDASFYVAWLKNREQVDAMVKSNAWKKLMAVPAVSMGLMQAQAYWEYPSDERLLQVKDWIEGPDGRRVLGLLLDAGSDEVAIFGDKHFATQMNLLLEFNSVVNRAQAETMQLLQEEDHEGAQQVVSQRIAEFLREHGDEMHVPAFAVGARLDDPTRAREVLDLIEKELRPLAEQSPVTLGHRLERKKGGEDSDLLTITLSGDMLLWEEIEMKLEDNPEIYAELHELLFDKQVVVAIGVVRNFFVLSVGESTDHLLNEPSGKLLVEHEALERLARHAGEKLTTVAYASDELMRALSSNERGLNDVANSIKTMLTLAPLDELRREAIESDLDELVEELTEYLPEASTIAYASFMTDRGYESFTYNWADVPPTIDGSKPLTLIDHVGDDSIAWYVARGKQSVGGYDNFVAWLSRIYLHVEAVSQSSVTTHDWEEYEKLRAEVEPLLKRLDKATREMVIPAVKNGQGGVVLRASSPAKKWLVQLPESKQELSLPTLALVYALDDAELLKQGVSEYFKVIQTGLTRAHEMKPDEVWPIILPTPEKSSVAGGELFTYPLPSEWGISERVAPSAAVSDTLLVLSPLPEVCEKLLAKSRPQLDGPAAKFDQPLYSAGHIKWAKLIETVQPWLDYGIQVAIQQHQAEDPQDGNGAIAVVGFVKPQVEQLLDILKVFHSSTSVYYQEDDVAVKHGELRLVDLE